MQTKIRTEIVGLEVVMVDNEVKFIFNGEEIKSKETLWNILQTKDEQGCNFFDHVIEQVERGMRGKRTGGVRFD